MVCFPYLGGVVELGVTEQVSLGTYSCLSSIIKNCFSEFHTNFEFILIHHNMAFEGFGGPKHYSAHKSFLFEDS